MFATLGFSVVGRYFLPGSEIPASDKNEIVVYAHCTHIHCRRKDSETMRHLVKFVLGNVTTGGGGGTGLSGPYMGGPRVASCFYLLT